MASSSADVPAASICQICQVALDNFTTKEEVLVHYLDTHKNFRLAHCASPKCGHLAFDLWDKFESHVELLHNGQAQTVHKTLDSACDGAESGGRQNAANRDPLHELNNERKRQIRNILGRLKHAHSALITADFLKLNTFIPEDLVDAVY